MDTRTRGVTFSFDESILIENRKLNVPLNILKNDSNLTKIFNNNLLNLNKTYKIFANNQLHSQHDSTFNLSDIDKQLDNFNVKGHNESNLAPNDLNKQKTLNPDAGVIQKLIETNSLKSKDVYNSLINDTLNELENLEKLEKELKEKQQREQLEREQRQKQELENQKQLEKQKELDRLKNEQNQLSAPVNIANTSISLPDGFDYIPKNTTVKLYEDFNSTFVEYDRAYSDIKLNANFKPIRIDISKRVTTCLNSLANTQKQIELIFNKLIAIFNEFPDMKLFTVFKIIEGILNCCEEGCQIYINNKSAWSFARLLHKLLELDQVFKVVYFTLMSQKCIFAIPRFYVKKSQITSNDTSSADPPSADDTDLLTLCKLYEYDLNNSNSDIRFNKRLKSFLTLHLSFFVVKNDFKSIWSFYSNVVNSSWENVLLPVIPNILITLLATTSHFMLSIYQLQFKKILMNIFQLLTVKLKKINYSSSFQMYRGQIEQFYQQYNSNGKIDVPDGYNMKYKEEELRRDV